MMTRSMLALLVSAACVATSPTPGAAADGPFVSRPGTPFGYEQWRPIEQSMHQLLADGFRLAHVLQPSEPALRNTLARVYYLSRDSDLMRCTEIYSEDYRSTGLSCYELIPPQPRQRRQQQ